MYVSINLQLMFIITHQYQTVHSIYQFFFYQNFLVSNILFENKNESKTIRVTWYLGKMLFSHRHHTLLIMVCKVSGFSWFMATITVIIRFDNSVMTSWLVPLFSPETVE